MPLLLVGMMRPVPQRDDLLALQRVAGEAAWLELSALGEAAVADLVAALAGGRPDSSLLRLADRASCEPALTGSSCRRGCRSQKFPSVRDLLSHTARRG